MDNNTVPDHTYLVLSCHKSISYVTASHSTYFRDFKDFPHLDISSDDFFKCRLKHSLDGIFDLVDSIVDDGIVPDLDLLLLCHFLGISGRPNLEAKDNSVRGRSQEHIGFGNLSDPFVNNIDTHFVFG